METKNTSDIPTLLKDEFDIDPMALAEIQKKLCRHYDEINKSLGTPSSAEVWSNLMKYIQKGLFDQKNMCFVLEAQEKRFLNPSTHLSVEAANQLEMGIVLRDKSNLVPAMGMFFAATLNSESERVDFTNKTLIDIAGIMRGYGF